MNKQDMQKVGQGYTGGFSTVTLTQERQALITAVRAAECLDRNSVASLLGDKTENYYAWRMGGSSVTTTLAKILNW